MIYACGECDYEMEFDIEFDQPPKPCSNPDSPAYSDPGQAGGVDGPRMCPKCGTLVDDNIVMNKALQEEIDAEERAADDAADAKMDAMREYCWEDDH